MDRSVSLHYLSNQVKIEDDAKDMNPFLGSYETDEDEDNEDMRSVDI